MRTLGSYFPSRNPRIPEPKVHPAEWFSEAKLLNVSLPINCWLLKNLTQGGKNNTRW